ncbi:MAG: DUF4249 domain-containing protein, partial [Cytophagales bacterium]|nr:DUF4249 domain-containing protein [Cytophagales bacterium]
RNYAYDIYIDTRDAPNTRDYYRWTAYSYHLHRSTGVPCSPIGPALCFIACWYPTYSRNVNIFSDAATNGQTLRKRFVLRSPVYYLGNHLVEVSQHSMGREAFQFWRLYQEQADRTGSIFDPLPASIEGNISNLNDPDDIALGFFAASGVARRKYVVSGDETFDPKIVYYIDSLRTYPKGNCLNAFPGSTLERPPGW